jgi:hypothetical protein
VGKKTVAVIIAIIGMASFGYIQYALASQINVAVTENKLIKTSEDGALHNLEIEFDNPSLLVLSAGKTKFTIYADDQTLGRGELDPFMLPALGKATASGTFLRDLEVNSDNPQIKIEGVTKYQMLFASIDVPFTYYPTQDQTSEFIAAA